MVFLRKSSEDQSPRPGPEPEVRWVALEGIQCRQQVRVAFDSELIAELAQTLTTVGQLQPIRVRTSEDGLIVVDGERRVRAAKLAGWTHILAIVEEAELGKAEVMTRQLVANCQRQDLRPMEKARSIQELMGLKEWTAAQVAEALGMSQSTVSKLLALLSLPEALQERVNSGEIAASVGYQIASTKDPNRRAELEAKAGAGRLTRAAVSHEAPAEKRGTEPRQPRVRAKRERLTLPLGDGRSLIVTAPRLSLEGVIDWLEATQVRLRELNAGGKSLAEVKAALKESAPNRSAEPGDGEGATC